ncbi:MAG: Gfo/Idh/MocA family oxidoreductase [bacterium]|nr:Gfo/Idh/MocA family oxidoreductase [bacterium]
MRAGVIGCGFQGRLHVESLQAVDGVEVVAVCDTDTARLDEVRSTHGVAYGYADYRDLLEKHDLDLVTVCTMPVHHMCMTVDAFATGAHVLCEKPLALDAAEGREMLRAASVAGRMLAIGFNMRFTPNAQIIKRHVDSGILGRPRYTHAWAKSSQIPWWGEHYRKEFSGGGALAATAVHFLDLALWFAGFPRPLTASAGAAQLFPIKRGLTAPDAARAARYNVDDLLSAHLRFEDGFWMTLQGSWIDNIPSDANGSPSWDYSLDAIGETAQAVFDPPSIRGERDGEIIELLPPETVSDVSFPPSVAALIAATVDAIGTGREAPVTGEQALMTQVITDAIYESAAADAEVAIDPSELDWSA